MPCLVSMLCLQAAQAQEFSLSYSGAYATHPGVAVGYSKAISTTTGVKEKLNSKEWRLGGYAGAYFHRNMHSAAYIAPQISFRKTRTKGGFLSYQLGVGVLKSAVSNVYERTGDAYKNLPFSGDIELSLNPAFTLGRKVESSLIDSWFVTNKIMYFPLYAQQSTFRYFLEIGISKNLSSKI